MFKQYDFHFYKSLYLLIFLGLFFYIIGNFCLPLYGGLTVTLIEHFQSLFLIFMGVYTYFYARRVRHHKDLYIFWIWTISWWLVMFGRGISWGRDFFPDVPRFYYKIIATILIAIPFIGMFTSPIRREIARRYKTEKIPVWFVFFAFLYLGVADIAEHHRIGSTLLVLSHDRKDLIEELMETPCLFSLGLVSLYLQHNEQKRLKNAKLPS
ncbi:hypothetical protein PT276_04740 [Orbaceae bacterium ESL0721]|nr:hypothetical protein [Orbaceae bacterium ESL0721]